MAVEIRIQNSASPSARYLTWAPSPCRIRVISPFPIPIPLPAVRIRLSTISAPGGGAVGFRSGATGAFSSSIDVNVPLNGASVPFFAAGRFPNASSTDGDVRIVARIVKPVVPAAAAIVAQIPVMVRIRKDANSLSPAERDRFLAALAQLNNQGAGRFQDFRDMHTAVAAAQAHGFPAFLPWHRAYLLDLERELQAIDRSVALPYWRFNFPAPNVFTPDYMGASDSLGTVGFSTTNPLQFWRTDGVQGVNRRPFFNTSAAPSGLRSETGTLQLGAAYAQFVTMEGNPHGSAHVSFGGFLSSVPTAAKDPLFFLLHSNVDRLWAMWQRANGRYDPNVAAAYDNTGAHPIGHNLSDTMWPWNGVTGAPRPPTAPGGTLAPSDTASAPGPSPRVRDLLDYAGVVSAPDRAGFAYQDVQIP